MFNNKSIIFTALKISYLHDVLVIYIYMYMCIKSELHKIYFQNVFVV